MAMAKPRTKREKGSIQIFAAAKVERVASAAGTQSVLPGFRVTTFSGYVGSLSLTFNNKTDL